MAVVEKLKLNHWTPKPQESFKQSQLAYSVNKYATEGNKNKLKIRFDWNAPEEKRRIRQENNYDNLPSSKKAKSRKYERGNRSQDYFISKQVEIEATFAALVQQWREENRGVSSINQMSMHPAYQQIIGMGEAAIPLLLRELEKKSGHWFWALKSITREDPLLPEHRGKIKEMTKAWLEWGKNRGYKW